MVVLPVVVPRELWRIEREDDARADAALRELLPFEVRAAGEAFRQYGAAVADNESGRALQSAKELRALLKQSREKYGDEPVLRLRAVQTRLFVAELARFEHDGKTSDELTELGGDFVDKARRAKWLTSDGKLVANDVERETLFRIRWSEIAGLRHERSFAPTLDEWRTYYRFMLQHPGTGGAAAQLQLVTALERIDLSYPGILARGVLLFRMGRYEASEQALRAYLRDNPQGPWRLRALNYLAAAVQEVKASQQF
jgi:predicted Zn-dependent protease